MIRTKIFTVTFAPHQGAEAAVQAKFDEIENGGGAVLSATIQNSSAYIIARVQTATQAEATEMVQSGEAEIQAEAIVSEGKTAEPQAEAQAPSKKKTSKKG